MPFDDPWFWVSCVLFLCVVGLAMYLWWRRTKGFVTVEGEGVLPLTTYDCGGAEHTLIYASQKEIKHLEDNFRDGRKGEPFKLPNGVTTRVKCYTRSDRSRTTRQQHNRPDPGSWAERRKAFKRSKDKSSGNPQIEINPHRAPRASRAPPPPSPPRSGGGNPQSGE